MEDLTSKQRHKLPYTVLLDPVQQRCAAYNQTHRLVAETASPKLLKFAQRPGLQSQPYSAAAHRSGHPDWYPLPAWATPEVQARLVLVWIRPPGMSEEELQAMPRK